MSVTALPWDISVSRCRNKRIAEAGTVTVRDMDSGEQAAVPVPGLAAHLARLAAGDDH